MAFRVEIARRAESDLEELYLRVVERAPQQGAKWFNGLERAILSLDQHPKRCPAAPENFDTEHPVRVLTYGRKPHTYRVFFASMTTLMSCACFMSGGARGGDRLPRK
jgi:plasmid stabilization system protein ParE